MGDFGDWASLGCLVGLALVWLRLARIERTMARGLGAVASRTRAIYAEVRSGVREREE